MNWYKWGIVGVAVLISPVMAIYILLFVLAINPKFIISFVKQQS